jgi:predicted Fe-Mo cluster-binding NifX family protein
MKILMPVKENNDQGRTIASGFHKAKFVCLYNSDDQSFEWFSPQIMCSNSENLSYELKRIGIEAVISCQMPMMALGFFAEIGIPVYNTETSDLDECIQLFSSNKLLQLTNATCKLQSSCGSSCSSCSSSTCQS